MKFNLLFSIILFACFGSISCQEKSPEDLTSKVTEYYMNHSDTTKASISKGTVSNGSLENGVLLPFSGPNYQYFDTTSYLAERAYVNDKVWKTVLNTYGQLREFYDNTFYIMETANKNGGKLAPHRTHQNGLSVDFMMPKIKKGKTDVSLDQLGKEHYFLTFDDNGSYAGDPEIKIDFEIISHHLLLLDQEARKNGLKIKKVIIKIELKDELFDTHFGGQLKKSGIYIVKGLDRLTNSLHDEHYHVDFAPL